jgi:hypothetical protein
MPVVSVHLSHFMQQDCAKKSAKPVLNNNRKFLISVVLYTTFIEQ